MPAEIITSSAPIDQETIQILACMHQAENFLVSPNRQHRNIKRLKRCEQLRERLRPYSVFVGSVALVGVGVELQHAKWLAKPDTGQVVDVSLPLFDEDFLTMMQSYIIGIGWACDAFEQLGRLAPIEARVLGAVPPHVEYYGRTTWGSGPSDQQTCVFKAA